MSPVSPNPTREKLLAAAESLVYEQGFAATSIDKVIERVGMTKGTFFYHFKSKNDLALALIQRYAASDLRLLHDNMARAEKLSDDPLQQVLIFTGLLLEVAETLDNNPQPGCLFATFCFESGLFDDATHTVIQQAMLSWRRVLADKLRAAAERHPPRTDLDVDSLADMATVIFEGSFVVARCLKGPKHFHDQLRHYRDYLRLLFDDIGK